MITIQLDWPDKRLSPNSRLAWQAKLEPKEKAAKDAYYAALEQRGEELTGPLEARLTFFPPSRRRMDLDNCLSKEKFRMDSICRALGIDDSQIRRVVLEWGEPVRGGAVTIRLDKLETR
jgi:crossover junction endodeoxyribonuclease RusA